MLDRTIGGHRSRSARVAIAAIIAAGIALGPTSPAPAWIGAETGYQTHDWFMDQAYRLVGSDASWLDIDVAREATDDPDNADDHGMDHVYRDQGLRGGAIQRVVDHYDAAADAYQAGRYTDASLHIGLLSHYYTDVLQPYHSHYDGIGETAAHSEYEHMVMNQTRDANDRPDWGQTGHTPTTISNIRSEAIAASAYARAAYPSLHALVAAPGTTFTAAIEQKTEPLMRRAVNDLADIIRSIKRGAGRAPHVDRLTASVKWRYPAQNEDWQHIYTYAYDASGRPIEGLEVRVTLPSGHTDLRYTDGAGLAYWSGPPGATPHYASQTVTVRATTDGHTESATTWWMTTPTLAAGSAGFSTTVDRPSPIAGQYVTARSTLRDTSGRPVRNVAVTWTWEYPGPDVTTTAVTNAQGVATSKVLITPGTTFERVVIRAKAQSGSQNRNSSSSFQRKAGDPVTPYQGWFVDIWESKFRDDIVWLAEDGITSGCATQRFCPHGSVTRAQMATFLSRALHLPTTSRDYFRDDGGSVHEAAINRLAASGITAGCGTGRFCPDGLVTRGQMATFLSRAFDLPGTSTDWFGDDAGIVHEPAINRLAASGITTGCGTGRFCPSGVVTRGQMAAFLRRALAD
jgi:hypothetical protein